MQHDKRLDLRHLRAGDGIALGTLLGTVVFCHPALGRTLLGDIGNLHMLPIAATALATWALPVPDVATAAWRASAGHLKFAALLVLGLGPFVSWWLRHSENLYLLLAASAGIAAACWYLMELAALVHEMSRACDDRRLQRESRAARLAIMCLLIIPVMAVHAAFATSLLAHGSTTLSDLRRTWMLIPPQFRVIMPLPILYLCWLLWLAQARVMRKNIMQPEIVEHHT